MKYKLVIFDFDGTLADSFAWFLDAINEAAARYAFTPIDRTRIDELRGYSGRQLMAHLALPLWKVPFVTMHMRQSMSKRITDIPLFEGVDHTFQALAARGIAIAVVTSNSRENVVRVLGEKNAALVGYYGCGASIFGKQAKLKTLLKHCSVAPHEVLCIGDEIRDAEAAAAMGMEFVGVSWGYTTTASLLPHSNKPLLTDFAELLMVVGEG